VWRNERLRPLLLDHYGATTIPIDLDVTGEVDIYQREAVLELRKEAEDFTACHQLAVAEEDNADAEVAFVPLNLDAEEVRNARNFSTQRKYTKQ
jgi:hypothetical protein